MIRIAATPNPDALKFQVPGRLTASTWEFAPGDDLSSSPLARELFDLPGVTLVLVAPEFVTVGREPAVAWEVLAPRVQEVLEAFLASYRLAVVEPSEDQEAQPASDAERQIVSLLDEYVRPAVAEDGGEVRYLGFSEGVVRLSLRGACGTCPSSMTTLKMGVERLLKEHVPEVVAVENVA